MELLSRNIQTLLPSYEAFEKKLATGKRLRIKFGIDPTGPNIHIGRAVALWKLREFQEQGHIIVLLFGDFTARIGDPSDKDKRRPGLLEEEIKANAERYLEQVGRILDIKAVELHYNSEWHEKMSEAQLLQLSRLLTVNQMLARRNFTERIEKKKEIGIDEFLYPLLQGYDSYVLKADVELGGADQLFNLEAGRIVQSALGQDPQLIIITQMLWGLDGRKMSTSWGNVVNITDEPQEMFGKLMTLDDKLMEDYSRLATRLSESEIKEIERIPHPKEQKERVAYEIVKLYHGEEAAQNAKENFGKPEQREISVPKGSYKVSKLLVQGGATDSGSAAQDLIEQRGIRVDGELWTDSLGEVKIDDKPVIIRRGTRIQIKVIPKK